MNDPQDPVDLGPWLPDSEEPRLSPLPTIPEGLWQWCRHNPIFTSLMAVGTVSLIAAIALMSYCSVTARDHASAKTVQPVRRVTAEDRPLVPGPASMGRSSPADSPER